MHFISSNLLRNFPNGKYMLFSLKKKKKSCEKYESTWLDLIRNPIDLNPFLIRLKWPVLIYNLIDPIWTRPDLPILPCLTIAVLLEPRCASSYNVTHGLCTLLLIHFYCLHIAMPAMVIGLGIQRSTARFVVFLGNDPFMWSDK